MSFKEYLLSKGVTEEQATEIVSGMPDENFHLASEEKLDERYSKLKSQKEQLEEDLNKANALVDDLQNSNKSNEDLQAQVEDYKTQLESVKAQRSEDQKHAAIELALTQKGARNVKAAKALLDVDSLEMTDEGIKGLDEQLNSIVEENDYLFQQGNSSSNDNPSIVREGNAQGKETTDEDAFREALGIK